MTTDQALDRARRAFNDSQKLVENLSGHLVLAKIKRRNAEQLYQSLLRDKQREEKSC